MKLQVAHRALDVNALLAQMRADAPAVAFVLEAGPLTEEEIAARAQLGLPRVRYALDLLGAEGHVCGSNDRVWLVTRRRGR